MLVRFLERLSNTSFARTWHRFVPSVTLSRRFLGRRLYFDGRDNTSVLVLPASELETHEWPLLELPTLIDGPVWDIGANIGLLTLAAASAGRRVTAFELSSRAAELLRMSRDANDLDFDVVDRAFAMTEESYGAPVTSHPGNRLTPSAGGAGRTITRSEAEARYGTPSLVKMDIEGMEGGFLADSDFKDWICQNRIIFYVELHTHLLGHTPIWADVPHVSFRGAHVLYCADAARLERLLGGLGIDRSDQPAESV